MVTRLRWLLNRVALSVPLALACGEGGPGGARGPDGGGSSGSPSSSGTNGASGSGFVDSDAGSGSQGGGDSATTDSTVGADASRGGFTDAASGQGGGGVESAAPPPIPPPACKTDITTQVLANANIAIAGDSCVLLPPGIAQYGGVISGAGTLTLKALNGAGTLVATADSTFTLPATQQAQTITKTANYYTIHNADPPVVFIESNATLQLGTATSTAGSIASNMPNTGTEVINRDNIPGQWNAGDGGRPE